MMTKNFRIIFVLSLLLFGVKSYGQNQTGILPQLNGGFKLAEGLELDSKIESRYIFQDKEFERLDFENVLNQDLNDKHSIGVGYLLRKQDGRLLHRAIQQFTLKAKHNSIKMSHRFRTDQSFRENEKPRYRLRYRFNMDMPLNGPEIDPNEYYFAFENEYLGGLQDSEGNFEVRLFPAIGYHFSDTYQLETGFDYRAEDLNSKTAHKLFLNVALNLSF